MENANYSDFVGQGMDVGDKFVGESINADGAKTKTKAGAFLSNISQKAKTAGQTAIQNNGGLGGIFGKLTGGANQVQNQTGQYQDPQVGGPGTPIGMSTGAKIGIGVGIVLVIGVVIWLATK